MAFNFKDTESAVASQYLQPGAYKMAIEKVEFGKFPKANTPYAAVTFITKAGEEFTEKFSITDNAISRLQYLHEGWFGKKCDKTFKSAEEVFEYFQKALTGKKIVKNILVGGNINNGTTYASLPYADFIFADGDYDLGPFEEGDDNWKKVVRKANTTSEAAGAKNGLLNDDDDSIGKGKAKAAAPKTAAKSTTAKATKPVVQEDPEEETGGEAEDEEMPW